MAGRKDVKSKVRIKLRKGDYVAVISGKDKGKKGDILTVDRARGRVLIQGVNMVKRHNRPAAGQPGGIMEKEAPVHVSNVSLIDPKDGNPSKVGYKFLDDGRKVRFARRSGEIIDR